MVLKIGTNANAPNPSSNTVMRVFWLMLSCTSATAVADLPSFTTYDVFGSYRPSALPQLTVDAGVYNLTDAYYYEHVSNTGDKAMGRNVKVALSYQF